MIINDNDDDDDDDYEGNNDDDNDNNDDDDNVSEQRPQQHNKIMRKWEQRRLKQHLQIFLTIWDNLEYKKKLLETSKSPQNIVLQFFLTIWHIIKKS